MINIGLFTPNQNPYSETFVQAHKNHLRDKVYYYFGTGANTQLEGFPPLASKMKRIWLRVRSFLGSKDPGYVKRKIILDSLKKRKIHVVLAEYGTHAHAILPIVKAAKIPMVVHFHGYDASVKEAIERCGNYAEVFEYASTVVVVSRHMEESLAKLGCPRKKLLYNPCGPRAEFEEVNPIFTKKQFVGIGRFVDKKAPYYTILAFKKVLQEEPNVNLVLAGDGVLLNTCMNLVKYLNLEDSVHFPGVISSDEFKEYLRESVAFVQHSIKAANGDMEGTPVSVMEAALVGLPVVATNHAGIGDVIIHEETGLLCDEHDVDTMAAYMIRMAEDRLLARELGSNSRIRIKDKFSLKKHIGLLQDALAEAVSNRAV